MMELAELELPLFLWLHLQPKSVAPGGFGSLAHLPNATPIKCSTTVPTQCQDQHSPNIKTQL